MMAFPYHFAMQQQFVLVRFQDRWFFFPVLIVFIIAYIDYLDYYISQLKA